MCFAPQRRALFRHLNLQKWSEPLVFLTFWLRNVLRATTACTFSTSQLPKVVRTWFWLRNVLRDTTACTFSTLQLPKVVRQWCVLYILTWKCASRHNGVQFFIFPLASWLRTRRFSEPTFRPSGATNHWKNAVNRDFPTFSRISIFFLLTLSLLLFSLLIFLFSLPLPCSAFHLSILSEVWLLNFLRQSLQKHVPVLPYTTKLAHTCSSTTVYYKACARTFQYYRILQSLRKHEVLLQLHERGFAASPIDTATCAQQNTRGFAACPVDTELTTPRRCHDDAKTTRRPTGGEQGSNPQTPQTINGNPSLRIREKT